MKPIDVTGYEEPIHLLAAEVVKPFETLVVKARMKITFTAGCLHCSTLAMGFKGWNSSTQVGSDRCLYSYEKGKPNSACCFVQHYGVTYPPQERAKDCSSTSCE